MASAEPSRAHTSEPIDVPNTFPLTQAMGQTPAGSTPVEMTTLSRPENVPTEPPEDKPAQESRPIQAKHSTSSTAEPSGIQDHTSQPLSLTTQPTEATSAAAQSQPVDTTPDCPPSSSTDHSPLVRSTTEPAIGPSTDKPSLIQADASSQTLFITLLLTNGARHPYKIDEKYLNKRNVSVEGNNPVLMSIYTLKELIWRDWRDGMQCPVYNRGAWMIICWLNDWAAACSKTPIKGQNGFC